MIDVTFLFTAGSRYGWSETHTWRSGDRAAALAAAQAYATARRNALPAKLNLKAIRMSDPEVYRDAEAYAFESGGVGLLVAEAEHPFVALLVRMGDGTAVNWKNFYYRGFKDSITDQDTPVPGAGPDRDLIELAIQTLIAEPEPGWGWYGRNFAVPTKHVFAAVPIEGGGVTLTVSEHGFTPGQKIQIRGERSMEGLNGHHVVATTPNVDTLTLPPTVRVQGPYGSTGKVQEVLYGYLKYGTQNIIRATRRATGRPFDVAVGRGQPCKQQYPSILAAVG